MAIERLREFVNDDIFLKKLDSKTQSTSVKNINFVLIYDAPMFLVTDLCLAQCDLTDLRGQHALHSVGNIVDSIVNDAVHTHFHLGGSSFFLGHIVRADVEADDDGVGGIGQIHVGLADGTDTGVDDADAHLIIGDLLQALLDGLGRTLHVGLDHDGQFLHVVLSHLAEQVIQRDLLEGGELFFLGGSDALLGQFTGQDG